MIFSIAIYREGGEVVVDKNLFCLERFDVRAAYLLWNRRREDIIESVIEEGGIIPKFPNMIYVDVSVKYESMQYSIINIEPYILQDQDPAPISIEKLESDICSFFGMAVDECRKNQKSRKREYIRQRQVFFASVKALTRISLKDMGSIYGKDHASVLHALKEVRNLYDTKEKDVVDGISFIEDKYGVNIRKKIGA